MQHSFAPWELCTTHLEIYSYLIPPQICLGPRLPGQEITHHGCLHPLKRRNEFNRVLLQRNERSFASLKPSRRREKDHRIPTETLFVAHVLGKEGSKRMLEENRYPEQHRRSAARDPIVGNGLKEEARVLPLPAIMRPPPFASLSHQQHTGALPFCSMRRVLRWFFFLPKHVFVKHKGSHRTMREKDGEQGIHPSLRGRACNGYDLTL